MFCSVVLQCSESSGSYKTANDVIIKPDYVTNSKPVFGNVKYYSDISLESSAQSSSNALDLTTTRKKRYSTITLTSDEESSPAQTILQNQSAKYRRTKPENVTLNLQVVCLLGTGGYGKVFLVRTKENLEKYYEEDSDKRSESSIESGIHLEPERRVKRGRGKSAIQYVRNSPGDNWAEEKRLPDACNYYALKVIKKSAVLKSQTDLRHLKMEQRILSRVRVICFCL